MYHCSSWDMVGLGHMGWYLCGEFNHPIIQKIILFRTALEQLIVDALESAFQALIWVVARMNVDLSVSDMIISEETVSKRKFVIVH